MDPEGNIYDMQGNFIGTANANELEEMEEDNINQQQNILEDQHIINWWVNSFRELREVNKTTSGGDQHL